MLEQWIGQSRRAIESFLQMGTELTPNERSRRRVVLHNGFALICVALNLCFTTFFIATGLGLMVVKQIVMIGVFASVIWLNHKGRFTQSKLLFLVALMTSIFGSTVALGLRAENGLLYATAGLPLLMCDLRERKVLVVGMALPVAYALLGVGAGDWLTVAPALSPRAAYGLRIAAVLAGFVALYSTLLSFVIANARAEDRLESAHAGVRLLLDRIDQGVATLDREGTVGPERSAIFDTWFGSPQARSPFAQCLGRLDPAVGAAFTQAWAEIERAHPPLDREFQQLPSTVTALARHYSLQYKPVFVGERFDGVMVVMSDVTLEVEKDLLERRRRSLEVELAHARKLEAVGQLAAGLAHEINTPAQFAADSIQFVSESTAELSKLIVEYRRAIAILTAGSEHAALVSELAAAEESADFEFMAQRVPAACLRALEGVSRISAVVSAMREFAEPCVTDKQPVDLNHALRLALTLAHGELRHAEVELDLGELPTVSCHMNEINQVFLTLLVNAGHAVSAVSTKSGLPGRIRIRTRSVADATVVQVDITDTGCGIPSEIRHRVFDPFFTTKEVGQGSGRGLAVARHIVVEKHRGSIDFESAVNAGTTFSVFLPVDGENARTSHLRCLSTSQLADAGSLALRTMPKSGQYDERCCLSMKRS